MAIITTVSSKQKAVSRNSNTAYCLLPTARYSRGFALLIAVIFMSVMLSFGLALGSLSYKQQILASTATASQYAFYVADAALECALYADQQQDIFVYPASDPTSVPVITCDGSTPISATKAWSDSKWIITQRLSLDSDKRCADVTVYKYKEPQLPSNVTTYLFSQGYDVSCATVASPNGARFVSRGFSVSY